jgi:hypothetical protein
MFSSADVYVMEPVMQQIFIYGADRRDIHQHHMLCQRVIKFLK